SEMSRLLVLALSLCLAIHAGPLPSIPEETSSELLEKSSEIVELPYPDKFPELSDFATEEEEGESSEERLSDEDRKTLEELILNPTITEEYVLNMTEPVDDRKTLGQKLKALVVKFQAKVKNLGANAKEVVDLVKENIRSMRNKKMDPNATDEEVKKTAWNKMVYTVKRWLALNDEGKAQLRKNFPRLAKALDSKKLQKQLCGFSCVVIDNHNENKAARARESPTVESPQ
ncbi:hypothetical protein PFISCL1PPCAC_1009, partial [Pristionchus fissidentatus]